MTETTTPPGSQRFLSLKWKALLLTSVFLAGIAGMFTGISYWTLQDQFERKRQTAYAEHVREIGALVQQSFQQLQRLGGLIPSLTGMLDPLLAGDVGRITREFDLYWPELQLNMGIDTIRFYNGPGRLLASWGEVDKGLAADVPAREWVKRVRKDERPLAVLHCAEGCMQYVVVPLLTQGRDVGAVLLGMSLADVVLEFRRQSSSDVALLSPALHQDGNAHHLLPGWGLRAAAVTQSEQTLAILRQIAENQPDLASASGGLQASLGDRQFEVRFMSLRDIADANAQLAIISDISSDVAQINKSIRQTLLAGLLGLCLFEVLLLAFLWKPMSRLRRTALSLPMLADGSFSMLRTIIGTPSSAPFLRDESDVLSDTAVTVSHQLEQLEAEVVERNRALSDRMEELAREKAFATQILNTAQVIIVTQDGQGRMGMMNHYGQDLTGYTEAEWRARSFVELLDESAELGSQLADVAAGSRDRLEHESVLICKDGSRRNILWYHSALPFTGGAAPVILGAGLDITEHKAAEAALRASESRYRELVQNANSIILRRDLAGRVTFFNEYAQTFFDYPQDSIIGRNIVGTIVPERDSSGRDLVRMIEDIGRHPEQYTANINENMLRDGRRVWISWTNKPVRDKHGQVTEILCVGNDITELKRAEDELRLSATVFENSIEGIVITDAEGAILRVNKSFSKVTGHSADEAVGQTTRLLHSGGQDARYVENMWQALRDNGFWQGEMWNRRKNGETYLQWLGMSAVKGADGNTTNYIGVFTDITEQRLSEERIYRLAHYDTLTGLPNRVLFQGRLQQALMDAQRNGQCVAILFLDIDRFKPINDSLGHPVGDLLLKEVAARLRDCVRESDTVARMGGDEFTVILPQVDGQKEVARKAALVARKIQDRLAAPFELKGHEIFVTASIGIVLYPSDGETPAELTKHADTAMYQAKAGGRAQYTFYKGDMNAAVADRLFLENKMRKALERREFRVFYQPTVDMASGEVIGVEALVRWQQPEMGLVPPDQFIGLAEETGLILPIGHWVLQEACRQAKAWQDAGLAPLRVAVNFSLRQFRQQNIAASVRSVLEETGLDPVFLGLEITESTFMDDVEKTVATLHELRGMGISLFIDDFGTGYSSLNHLKRFPVDAVKIDRSFVKDVTADPDDAGIVAAIIAMAHSLKLQVVAEGVETEEQEAFLKHHACDEIQGYLIGKPMPADDFARFLGDCHGKGWRNSAS